MCNWFKRLFRKKIKNEAEPQDTPAKIEEAPVEKQETQIELEDEAEMSAE